MSGVKRAWEFSRLAGDFSGLKSARTGEERSEVLEGVVRRLGLLNGLPQKVGQILSFSELEESSPVFHELTEGKAGLEGEEAFDVIRRRLGESDLNRYFRSLEGVGIGASLGQVHQGVLRDGREVAVKFLYPGIREKVRFDLKALKWISSPLGNSRYDLSAYRGEVGRMLEGELNYEREGEWIDFFYERLEGWKDMESPQLIKKLCRDDLLVMEWLGGESFSSVLHWDEKERKQVGEILLKWFLSGLFSWGCLHADPHPGNYRFRREGGVQVGVFDFGCVKELSDEMVAGFRKLIEAVRKGEGDDEVLRCAVLMGFSESVFRRLGNQGAKVMRILVEPFTCSGGFDLSKWRVSERIADVLGSERMAFRTAGSSEMLFLVRSFQGVYHYLKSLKVPINWGEKYDEVVGERLHDTSEPIDSNMMSEEVLVPVKSEFLRVCVERGGERRVDLTFQAKAVDHLHLLIPEDLMPKLDGRGISLETISEEVRGRGYERGEVFVLVDGEQTVRVWLE